VAWAPARAEEGATWIVVPAPALAQALEPLVEHRRAQGYRVETVDLAALPAGEDRAEALRAHLLERCRDAKGLCRVLLVGAYEAGGGVTVESVVPTHRGSVGRMAGRPTDAPYGNPEEDGTPRVVVGRLPVRTPDEASAVVEKTIDFETSRAHRPWRRDVALIVGNPGGGPGAAGRFAEHVVKNEVGARLAELHPIWRPRALIHVETSPFFVADAELGPRSVQLLEPGQLFAMYLGHSGAGGCWSQGQSFLGHEDWARMPEPTRTGVLLSCGCFTCSVGAPRGEGFGLAALRATGGPVAVIGAHGESYGAFGKLAFEGIFPLLKTDAPPERVGEWYLAMQRGIARGPISSLTFWMYDRADGSNGQVPLEVQRREHAQMWTLLGDPALRLPVAPPAIALKVDPVRPGAPLAVRGTLPSPRRGEEARVIVTVERPFADPPPPTETSRTDGATRATANETVIGTVAVPATEDGFEALVPALPDPLPWDHVIVRARMLGGDADGVARVAVQR
jgi:hypothetical protein